MGGIYYLKLMKVNIIKLKMINLMILINKYKFLNLKI